MRSPEELSGLTWIVAATLIVSAIISLLFGTFSHWPIVIARTAVGLWAAKIINR
jgi:hypothetical protein